MTDRQTAAFDKAGSFFAFGIEQFQEQKKEGVRYMQIGSGMLCPVENAKVLLEELRAIYKESIAQDIKENGLNAIIRRELNNHEAYYTRDIEDTLDALADYPITAEDIQKVFRNKNKEVVATN